MERRTVCWSMLLLLTTGSVLAQTSSTHRPADTTAPPDSLWKMGLDPVVVTATRSERTTAEVGVPVSVLEQAEIASRGAARLTDLLEEEPGLTVTSDHGSGLQMRGLDSEYTLILIDGEPVIGRTAGTFDLDRLTTANVKRVEVVRGPTSSLYGSDALAGVVNVITERPDEPLAAEVRSRYATHRTVDVSARLAGRSGPWEGSVFISRYRTGGYDLTPQTLAPTRPGYVDYTAQARGRYEAGPRTTLTLQGRLATQSQDYTVGVQPTGTSAAVPHTQDAGRLDWSVTPKLEQGLGAGWTLTGTLYGAGYHTDQTLRNRPNGTVRSTSALDQHQGEADVILRGAPSTRHLLTIGGGATVESVDADRKSGTRTGGFSFIQDEWRPTDALSVTGSVRFDANSDYASRLSPKLTTRYDLLDRLSVRASVGSGYKAPAFRQLYLDFTNPQAGYSVLGATEVQTGIQRLQAQGQIAELFRSVSALGTPLSPETSWAFNAGLTATLWPNATLRLDAYHNEVDNLIDTEAVARKPNGQNVFTYVNRNEVFTRGIEARLRLRPANALQVDLGYDYLEAKDRQVLRDLKEGTIYRRENGRDVAVTPSEYGGLPDRSTHSGTVQLRYVVSPLDLTASVRGVLRGRYGDADRNGNGIVDADREYVDGYTLWDVTLSKVIRDNYTLRIGSENVLDYTSPSRIPSLPGRRWFVEGQARF